MSLHKQNEKERRRRRKKQQKFSRKWWKRINAQIDRTITLLVILLFGSIVLKEALEESRRALRNGGKDE